MSKAEELLESLTVIEHEHEVEAKEVTFEIDPETRTISNVTGEIVKLVQGDHKSTRFVFNMPRYINGHDMMLCNMVYIPYINAEPDGRTQKFRKGVFTAKDMQLVDNDTVKFTWLVTRNSTYYAGALSFMVIFQCMEGERILYSWNAEPNADVVITAKLDSGETFELEYIDIIEQWKSSVKTEFTKYLELGLDERAVFVKERVKEELTQYLDGEIERQDDNIGSAVAIMNDTLNTFDDILKTEITDMDSDIDVLKARMDTFTALKEGSTTGDAELADGRIGGEGEIYPNIGEAIRGQFNRNNNRLDNLIDGIIDPCGRQILDFSHMKQNITVDIYTGATVETTDEYYGIDKLLLVDRTKDHYIIYDKNTRMYLYFFDSKGTYLSYIFADSSRKLDEFPENTKYVKVVFIRNGEGDDVSARKIWLLEGSPKTTSTLILNDGNVSEEKCSFFIRDLLKQDEVEYGMVFNPEYGNPYAASDRSLTGYIDVTNVRHINTNFTFYIAYYDENFVFIGDIADGSKHTAGAFELPVHESLKYARILFITEDQTLIETYHISNCEEPFEKAGVLRQSCLPDNLVGLEERINECEENVAAVMSSWYNGKKITAYGDSITEGNKWQPYVANKFGCTMVNCGIGGTTVANNGSIRTINGVDIESWMCSDDRINLIPEDSDVILLFGGANDWSQSIISMGVLGDGNLIDNTFKSAYSLMIKKLVNKFPNAKLIAMTPINGRTSAADANEDKQHIVRGFALYDFAVAVKEVCMYYGIPCIDIHGESGINTFNHTTYIGDIVHPNAEGGKLIANAVINGMKRFEPIDL